MAEAKSATERAQVRSTVSRVVTEVFDEPYLRELAENVKSLTKGVWGDGVCPECGSAKKVKVEVPDLASQIKALTELLEQAEGRPGTAEGEPGGVHLIIERVWPPARAENPRDVQPAAPAGRVSLVEG